VLMPLHPLFHLAWPISTVTPMFLVSLYRTSSHANGLKRSIHAHHMDGNTHNPTYKLVSTSQ